MPILAYKLRTERLGYIGKSESNLYRWRLNRTFFFILLYTRIYIYLYVYIRKGKGANQGKSDTGSYLQEIEKSTFYIIVFALKVFWLRARCTSVKFKFDCVSLYPSKIYYYLCSDKNRHLNNISITHDSLRKEISIFRRSKK